MKARIKATGEIIDGYFANGYFVQVWSGHTLHTLSSGEFELITEESQTAEPSIDWEQREWEASVAAMQGLLANPNRELRYDSTEMFSIECIERALSLITEYQKQQKP